MKCERCGRAGAGVYGSELYKRYVTWAKDQGYGDKEIMTAQGFGRRISDRFSKRKDGKGTFYEDIALTLPQKTQSDAQREPEAEI